MLSRLENLFNLNKSDKDVCTCLTQEYIHRNMFDKAIYTAYIFSTYNQENMDFFVDFLVKLLLRYPNIIEYNEELLSDEYNLKSDNPCIRFAVSLVKFPFGHALIIGNLVIKFTNHLYPCYTLAIKLFECILNNYIDDKNVIEKYSRLFVPISKRKSTMDYSFEHIVKPPQIPLFQTKNSQENTYSTYSCLEIGSILSYYIDIVNVYIDIEVMNYHIIKFIYMKNKYITDYELLYNTIRYTILPRLTHLEE